MSGRSARGVLIIVQNLPVPFDRRVWLEATTLERNGFDVSVISPKGKGFTASRERIEGVEVYRYRVPGEAKSVAGYLFEFSWCLARTALLTLRVHRDRGFEVIHACNPPDTFWLLAILWRLLGKRFVFDHHDLSPEMYVAKGGSKGLLYRGLLVLERMSFATSNVVITTNASHKGVATTRGRKRSEDVYIVRSGPDVSRLKRFAPDPRYFRGKRYLLAYLGEICEQDGVDHLVRAIRILNDDFGRRDFHCVFMGGGPHQAAIRDYASSQGVGELCEFTGRVTDETLCRVLSSAHVGVDPDPKTDWSDKSTMNKIMEYMFFGLPIVGYDLAENRFSAQDAALYAVSGSEVELARCIDALLDDPDRRARMATVGERRLHAELAWEHSVAPLLEAYGRVFSKSSRRGRLVLDGMAGANTSGAQEDVEPAGDGE